MLINVNDDRLLYKSKHEALGDRGSLLEECGLAEGKSSRKLNDNRLKWSYPAIFEELSRGSERKTTTPEEGSILTKACSWGSNWTVLAKRRQKDYTEVQESELRSAHRWIYLAIVEELSRRSRKYGVIRRQ